MQLPIFFDVDNTLLTDNLELTERTRKVLCKTREKGFVITICSGRCFDALLPIIEKLGFTPWTVCLNGAYIMDDKCTVLESKYLTKEHVHHIVKTYEKYNGNSIYFCGKKWGCGKKDRYDLECQIVGILGSTEDLAHVMESQEINKLLVDVKPEFISQTIAEIKSKYPELEIAQSGFKYLECNSFGCTKGNGVLRVCKELGVSPADSYCFGDYYNDMSMFNVVGNSVAMGNAVQELKQKAKYITLSNNEDGIAVWLEKNLLL